MSNDDYIRLLGVSAEQLDRENEAAKQHTRDITILHDIPSATPPTWACGPAPDPQDGEILMLWQTQTNADPETWENVPMWLGACLDREFIKFKQLSCDAESAVPNNRALRQMADVTETGIKLFFNQKFGGEVS